MAKGEIIFNKNSDSNYHGSDTVTTVNVEDDKKKKINDIVNRMIFVQRRHAIEGTSIKNQTRAFLFALELQSIGAKPEDL